ncbi:AraC family transcriptional regulator [Aureibacillus halotolerans]|uniref:AraC-like protein n=1 Tax=Aureibacillus halotolerans TaxID=1508390 RepID=A0A4R6U840_9BACI|nr:AraC family transcriptional regulator [Aureibacillus halotolerans]TDQ42698.1 AraC-like protein [Aureibacillus halotolerans]
MSEFKDNYSFHFNEQPAFTNPLSLVSTGWERTTSPDYQWNGNERTGENVLLFQYTLSGYGLLQTSAHQYEVHAGQGFLVWLPSDHHYGLPNTSTHWEFLYVMFKGNELQTTTRDLVERVGSFFHASPDASSIKILRELHQLAKDGQIRDGYLASSLSYQFLLELYRLQSNVPFVQAPSYIQEAVQFITMHFATIDSIETLSKHTSVSRAHFYRQFRRYTGLTANDYLVKVRLEQAAMLLKQSKQSLDDIAHAVGFSSGHYLSKVFRQWIGLTPGSYRRSTSQATSGKLIVSPPLRPKKKRDTTNE